MATPSISTINALSVRPASETIATLNKFARDLLINKETYSYTLSGIFAKAKTFNGTFVYAYHEKQAAKSADPLADTTLADFTGTTSKFIEETAEAKRYVNVKTKIYDDAVMNFKVNPSDGIASLMRSSANMVKELEKTFEIDLWKQLDKEVTVIDTTGKTAISKTGDSVNSLIYKKLLSLQTTSKKHEGIGVNGVITTADGQTVSPATSFNSNEFILIKDINFEADTTFQGDRSYFNWGAKQQELGGVFTMDLSLYEPLDGVTLTKIKPAGFHAILLHKSLFHSIEDWNMVKVANTPKAYQIIHQYVKYNIYRLKDKPAFIFQDK